MTETPRQLTIDGYDEHLGMIHYGATWCLLLPEAEKAWKKLPEHERKHHCRVAWAVQRAVRSESE